MTEIVETLKKRHLDEHATVLQTRRNVNPFDRELGRMKGGINGLVIGLLGLFVFASPYRARAEEFPSRFQRATVIHFQGEINRRQFKFFESKLKAAQRRQSDLVILVIDSPGGLLEESMEMGRMLRDVDWARTVALIPNKAISGAALFSLGCDRIVMGTNARFGDAGVIALNENFLFQYVEAKLLSDVVRQVRDLAESKGRSPDLAEALVDRSAVVYQRPSPDGTQMEFTIKYAETKADGELEIEPSPPGSEEGEAEWVLVPETRGNRFLEVNSRRALELGLCEQVTPSLDDYLASLQFDQPPLELRPTATDSVVFWLNHPLVTFVLILVGLIALYIELSAPGISVGGLISGLCFVLFFWSRFLGGTAGILEILLFVAGVVFILMELFVIPGFGLSGILGILFVLGSVVMASQTFIIPHNTLEWNKLAQSLAVVVGSFLTFGVVASLISRRMGTLPVFKRLVLSPPEPMERSESSGDGGKALSLVKVGDWGVAESVLRPAGKARFQRRSVDVVADGAYVEAGTAVQVVEISGNRIVVAPDSVDDAENEVG